VEWLISDDEAINVMKGDCHYCGVEPISPFNVYKTKGGKYSSQNTVRCDSAEVLYNGIDRIDSWDDYTVDNIVTCCTTCNFAKNDRTYDDFFEWVDALNGGGLVRTPMINETRVNITGRSKYTDYHTATWNLLVNGYKHNAKKRGFVYDLPTDYAIAMMQDDCHYCGSNPYRVRTLSGKRYSTWTDAELYKSTVLYNGIDRKSSDLGYSIDNTVTCCNICNGGKNTLEYDKFIEWIERIKEFNNDENNIYK
jgi:hypothetical protein